jgi:hypothetical protein
MMFLLLILCSLCCSCNFITATFWSEIAPSSISDDNFMGKCSLNVSSTSSFLDCNDVRLVLSSAKTIQCVFRKEFNLFRHFSDDKVLLRRQNSDLIFHLIVNYSSSASVTSLESVIQQFLSSTQHYIDILEKVLFINLSIKIHFLSFPPRHRYPHEEIVNSMRNDIKVNNKRDFHFMSLSSSSSSSYRSTYDFFCFLDVLDSPLPAFSVRTKFPVNDSISDTGFEKMIRKEYEDESALFLSLFYQNTDESAEAVNPEPEETSSVWLQHVNSFIETRLFPISIQSFKEVISSQIRNMSNKVEDNDCSFSAFAASMDFDFSLSSSSNATSKFFLLLNQKYLIWQQYLNLLEEEEKLETTLYDLENEEEKEIPFYSSFIHFFDNKLFLWKNEYSFLKEELLSGLEHYQQENELVKGVEILKQLRSISELIQRINSRYISWITFSTLYLKNSSYYQQLLVIFGTLFLPLIVPAYRIVKYLFQKKVKIL